jgi:hypothetical protein
VAFESQQLRWLSGDGFEALAHGGLAGHLTHMQGHVCQFLLSPLPSPYQGSITQSWPKATVRPAASSSGTRVMPRRVSAMRPSNGSIWVRVALQPKDTAQKRYCFDSCLRFIYGLKAYFSSNFRWPQKSLTSDTWTLRPGWV